MRLIIALSLCVCLAFACDQLWSSSVVPCGQPGFNCPPGVTPPGQDLSMVVQEADAAGVPAEDLAGQPPNDFAIGPPMDFSVPDMFIPPPPDLTIIGGPDMKVMVVVN